jgi:DNA-binding transcriptional ArsR family regulator
VHIFAVLGDPVRFRIVEILASGSHVSGEIADAITGDFGISRSAVSHHLRILRDEGVVAVHADDYQRIYRLRWNTLDRIDQILLDLYEKWDQRMGWPYLTDPAVSAPRRRRLKVRAPRPRSDHRRADVEPRLSWMPEDDEPDDDLPSYAMPDSPQR